MKKLIISMFTMLTVVLSASTSLYAQESYVYDANKNVTAETSTGTVMDDYSFTAGFDDADRVTSWNRSNTDSQSWSLDLIGNWGNTTGSLAGSSFNESRTHNDVHELTTAGSNSLTYDAKGNTNVDANGIVLVWDIDNHLKSHGLVNFTYDALGRRLEKSELANSTLFICGGQRVIEEYEDSGSGYALERSYVYGTYIDDVIAKIEDNSGSPTPLYYHSDRQLNVRGLTDSSGDIVELYAYSVYGQQTVLSLSSTVLAGSSYDNNYGFTGRYLDDETDLWYFRARYFSDELGRFISRDPLGYVDGMSLYVGYFAQGFGLDPSGLEKCNCLGIYIIFEYNPDTGLNNEGIASNADILKHGKMWKDNGPEKIKLAIKMTGVGQSFKKIEDKIKQLIKHGGKEDACCKKEKYNLYLFGHASKKKGFLFPVKLKLFDPLEGDVENAKHNKPFVGNLRFKVTKKNQYQRYSIDNGGLGVESFKKATSGSCFTTLVACWSNKTKRWKGFKGQAYKEKYNYALNKRTSNDNHVEVYPKKK